MRLAAYQVFSAGFNFLMDWARPALVAMALCGSAMAERPSAMKLFPEETVVFLRLKNANEFGEKFQETSLGRMIQDPQLKPFVESLYGKAGDVYAEHAQEKVGVSWEDLKNLPKGEVAFGVIAQPHGRPALLLIVDQGDQASVADKLVDRALDLAEKSAKEISTEKIGDVEVTVVRTEGRRNRTFGLFERDNTIVVATELNVLRNVLWHWDHPGEAPPSAVAAEKPADVKDKEKEKSDKPNEEPFVPSRTLAENTRFATIVKECRRPQDPPPQLLLFLDPISLARNIGRQSGGMQMALAMMPMLGIDGLSGIGGAVTYATDEYDNLTQVHVLLENPRSGILQLPAFENGDTTPQAFVPKDIETYFTWSLNARTTFDRGLALAERFGAKDAADRFIKDKLSEKLGIDVPTQIIDNLKGRFTWLIGYDRPASIQSRQQIIVAELNDEKAATEALKTVVAKYPEIFEEKHFGNVTYYAILPNRLKDLPPDERPANPFAAITDGYLFLGTSDQIFEQCITARDGTVERLADSDDYKRATQVLNRETAGKTPVMFSTTRFEETIRHWYDVLTSPKTRAQLEEHKDKNPVLAALAETLDQNKLPPFDTLLPYFAPSGGILYDTDNGYHGISFQLRDTAEK